MRKLFIIFSLLFSITASAASLQPSDSKLINDAGIPLFADAIFVYGNKDLGFRFATNTSADEVKKWYRTQLPKWALFNEYGGWILHDGVSGIGMGEVMSQNQISVQHNENLPGWYSLDKNMTTEIVIMIVK